MNGNHHPGSAGPGGSDCGPNPFVTRIGRAAQRNSFFRTVLWTGRHLQLTLMCVPSGGEIGLERHPNTDQLLCIKAGNGTVMMGSCKEKANFRRRVSAGDAIFVPAGMWHNLINSARCPMKIISVYAPPQHPHGTIHPTKAVADAAEN